MQSNFCRNCGNVLREGDKFCRRCGTQVRKTAADEPKAPVFYSSEGNKANPEGTTLLVNNGPVSGGGEEFLKGSIRIALGDMLGGCTRIVDFGTGTKYEICIPAGLMPGDSVIVRDTGIRDPKTGQLRDIELTINL